MKRATLTIPAEMEEALELYLEDQEAVPSLTAVMQAALREYLTDRGYLGGTRTLRITPSTEGSGKSDVSVDHDHYLTER